MKTIDSNTKISELIKANDRAIDIISSINKNFEKLKNPVLRKLLAPRINIAQAAKIGNSSISEFMAALKKIGFEPVDHDSSDDNHRQNDKPLKMNKMEKVKFDVRPILESGEDPFKKIMEKLKTLNDQQALVIINKFEPIPLLEILKDKGYAYETTRPGNDEVHTTLFKSGEKEVDIIRLNRSEEITFEEIQIKYQSKLIEIDVRDLEMPLPMVKILEDIESIEAGNALFVHHKKLPQYLIPELRKRGFDFVSKEIDESNIKLIIFKS